jgi:hypothetical protein
VTKPTREQLDNLLDRATDHQLTHGEVDRLRAGIAGLRQQLDLILAPIPALIAERDHHAAAMQRVRDLHRPWTTVHGTHCNECSHLGVEGTALVGRVVDMPCPTLRALDGNSAPLTDHQPKEQA